MYIIITVFLLFGLAHACTNFIVTKGASADGSTMITYAADSHILFGALYHSPAADHAPGTVCLPFFAWLIPFLVDHIHHPLVLQMRTVIDWDSQKRIGQIHEVGFFMSYSSSRDRRTCFCLCVVDTYLQRSRKHKRMFAFLFCFALSVLTFLVFCCARGIDDRRNDIWRAWPSSASKESCFRLWVCSFNLHLLLLSLLFTIFFSSSQ